MAIRQCVQWVGNRYIESYILILRFTAPMFSHASDRAYPDAPPKASCPQHP